MGNSMEKNDDKKHRQNKILGNVIKWVLILGLLAFACLKNQDFMREAIDELHEIPVWMLVVCLILANLYFVAEGAIIGRMTSTGEARISIAKGISCAYMCAFYRLATLGSGNGIAQLYYYNKNGIRVSEGTGMSIAQYTFQKITIGIMGVMSFIGLLIFGERELLDYAGYMFAGVIVISVISIFLCMITVSKKISDLVMFIARKLVKEKWKLYKKLDDAQNAIDNLQNQGRLIWKDKTLFLQVIILDVIKLNCWYVIPGILFAGGYNVNVFVCTMLMAVCNMLGCVMIAPSGVGTLDFVFAVFFGRIIPDGEYVAAAIVIYRFFTWIVPFVIGLIPAAFLRKTNESHQ